MAGDGYTIPLLSFPPPEMARSIVVSHYNNYNNNSNYYFYYYYFYYYYYYYYYYYSDHHHHYYYPPDQKLHAHADLIHADVRGRVYPVGRISTKMNVSHYANKSRFVYPCKSFVQFPPPSSLETFTVDNIFDLLRQTVVGK